VKKKILDMPLVGLALVVLVGIAAYSNTLQVPFHFDDRPAIEGNPLIRQLSNVPSLLAGTEGIFASRAVMHATFALNYHFGGLDTTGYHAVNIALHMLNGLLLYLLVLMTGRHLGRDEKATGAVAFLSYALFVLHPVQTEAVTNLVNRSMLLSTACYLSGMLLFLRAVTSERRRGLWVAGLFAVSLAGMGSRENFATFPLMLLLYDLFFISGFKPREVARHYIAYLPVLLSLGYMAHLALGSTYAKREAIAGIPPVQYALTQLKVHWTYLRLLLFPVNQTLDYDYPVAKSLLELPALVSLAGYGALWAGGIALARRRPVVAFSVLWFLIALLPISFIVALTDLKLDDVIFEHRLYLPGAGAMVLAGAAIDAAATKVKQRWRLAGKAVVPLLLVLPVLLAAATYHRNAVWHSDVTLWEDAARKAPGKARPHNDLGIAYKNSGELEKSIEQSEIAIRLDPNHVTAYINLGNSYYSMGMLDRAIDYYRSALLFRPYYTEAYYNLGVAYQNKGLSHRAIRYYERAIELNPSHVNAHLNLGIAYLERGSLGLAQKEFERVLQIMPGDERALMNLRKLEGLRNSGGTE
jgi:tetratricopeptide (TPR) repeat protein